MSQSVAPTDARSAPGRAAWRLLGNGLLALASFVVCLVVAEAATRVIDDLPAVGVVLPERVAARGLDTTAGHFDRIPRAVGTSRELYLSDPLPLPNRTAPPPERIALR